MKKIIDIIKKNHYMILMMLIFLCICYFFPYVHDDWAWGSSIGMERLNNLFKNYNGRWAGNILVMLLTRSNIFKTLFMFIIFIATIKLIDINFNKTNKNIIYLIIFLLLIIPVPIIRQTISWTSGFANYCIPIPIILYIIYINRNLFELKKFKLSNKLIILNLLLGFIVSLFMEHVTIYNLILSFVIVFFDKKTNEKVNKANIAYLVGSILGTILMFSNGAYLSIFNSTDTYRTIERDNIIITAVKTYFSQLSLYSVTINKILNIVLSILLLGLNYKNKKSNKFIKLLNVIFLFFLSYNIFSLFNENLYVNKLILNLCEGTLVALFCLSTFYTVCFSVNKKIVKNKLLFYLISIILLIAPLTVVTPLGPRCFYVTYIFFILFAVEIFNYLNIKNEFLFSILKGANLFILILYFIIFLQVFIVDCKRYKLIDKWMINKEEQLILPSLPYEKYLWNPNPNNSVFIERFKLFNGIDEDVNVIFYE